MTTIKEFLKRKIEEREKAKQRSLAYTDAVKRLKVLQIERKGVIDELTSISNFMSATELIGENNVRTK